MQTPRPIQWYHLQVILIYLDSMSILSKFTQKFKYFLPKNRKPAIFSSKFCFFSKNE